MCEMGVCDNFLPHNISQTPARATTTNNKNNMAVSGSREVRAICLCPHRAGRTELNQRTSACPRPTHWHQCSGRLVKVVESFATSVCCLCNTFKSLLRRTEERPPAAVAFDGVAHFGSILPWWNVGKFSKLSVAPRETPLRVSQPCTYCK